eukprot:3941503-Rhodomonas_salina.1
MPHDRADPTEVARSVVIRAEKGRLEHSRCIAIPHVSTGHSVGLAKADRVPGTNRAVTPLS